MPDVLQFAYPPRLNAAGTLADVIDQSGTELAQRVHILLRTPPGWLAYDQNDPMDDFGLADQAHLQGGPDVQEIERQLDLHLPGGLALAVQEDPAALNDALGIVDIRIGG